MSIRRDFENKPGTLNQSVPDSEQYAAALAEDVRYLTLAETLRRAHVVAAQIRETSR